MRARALPVVVALLIRWASAKPIHAAIEAVYDRYLEEQEDVESELSAWMDKFQDQAASNRWIPATESRSADDVLEDHKQRFFLTKQRINELALENLDANFSTDSPFTLLTDEEFGTYIANAYVVSNALTPTGARRRLHGWAGGGKNTFGFGDLPNTGGGGAGTVTAWTKHSHTSTKGGVTTTTTTTTTRTTDNTGQTHTSTETSTTTQGATRPGKGGRGHHGRHHRHHWNKHWPNNDGGWTPPIATVIPWLPRDHSAPISPAVVVTTAPATETPVTTSPATAAPSVTTSAPATAAPSTTYEDTSATTSSPTAVSDSLDWSTTPCVTAVQSQGQCGGCWAFATVGAVEAAQCIANGQKSMTKYSEQQLVSCDSRNNGCGGGAPVYALEYVADNGLCTESDFPYTSSSGVSGSSCSSSCQKYSTGVSGSISLTAGDEGGLISALAQHPVIVAVASGNTAWKQYSGGVLSTCDSSSLDHAVLVVGYDSTAFKIKNSWGTDWGEQGYVRLRRGTSGGMGTCGMLTDMYHPALT